MTRNKPWQRGGWSEWGNESAGTCTARWISAERLNSFAVVVVVYLIIKLRRISSNPHRVWNHGFDSDLLLVSKLKMENRWWVIRWLQQKPTICSVPTPAGEWVLQYVESIPSCVSQVLIQCLCTERKQPDLRPPARLALKVTYKGKEDQRVRFMSILKLHQT